MRHQDCLRCLSGLAEDFIHPTALVVGERITYANSNFMSFLGMPESAVIGAAATDLFPGLSLEMMVQNVRRTRKTRTVEREILLGTRAALLSLQVRPTGDDGDDAVILTVMDRAPLRRGQIAMLRQASRTRSDQQWIVDEHYVITYTSADEKYLYGVGVGDSIFDVLSENDWTRAKNEMREGREQPGKIIESFYIVKRGRETFPIHTSSMFLHSTYSLGNYYIAVRVDMGGGPVDRLKEAYKADSDAALAEALGVTASSVSRARKAGIPHIWAYGALSVGYSGDWIMTGKGNKLFLE